MISIIIGTFKTIFKTLPICVVLFILIQEFFLRLSSNIFLDSLFFTLILLIQSTVNLITQVAFKFRKYKQISVSGVVQNFFTYFFQIILANLITKSWSLFIGYVIGRILSLLAYRNLIREFSIKIKTKNDNKFKLESIHYFASKYLIASSTIEAVVYILPSIFVAYYFGINYVGLVAIVQTILIFPTTLFGSTYGSVLYSEFNLDSNNFEKNQRDKILFNFALPVSIITSFFIIFSTILGPIIFNVMTNDKWQDGAILIRLLSFSFGINILWRVITYFFYLTSKWKIYYRYTIFNLILAILFMLTANLFNLDWVFVVFFYYIGQTIGQILGLLYTFKSSFLDQ
jgi:O-antigen/teichoic acid export membrane protein